MSRTLEHRIEQLEKPGLRAEQSVWVMFRGWDEWYPAPSRADCVLKWPELASREESWFLFPAKDGEVEEKPGWFTWDCETDDAEYRPSVRFMTIAQFVAIVAGDGDIENAECLPGWVRVRRRQMYEESGVNVAAFGREIVARLRDKIQEG